MLTIIRSSLLLLGMIVATILYSLPCVIARLLPYRLCFRFISSWCAFNTFWARLVCGVRYEIQGLEKIPEQSCVIMSNHQSTWETLAFPGIFPTLTWVIKKELLALPFFGWGIGGTQPIALDRKAGKRALIELVKDGRKKLALGRFVLLFPEGTRMPFEKPGKLKAGGFLLATKAGVPVLPVAHDAGRLWPSKGFLKQAGTVRVIIGDCISSEGKSAEELRDEYAQWLTQARQTLADQQAAAENSN
ncbi:1-acyl-sn-glycerol-3-phosphate acyltransferase [Gammaproteobacteria bacterium]|mgnify:FL=1|jgi:1-acyl-sn-glycerol-3-phosphate acyltransferase|nr:1-acyl-sn-glycerol-3-phosphate acyltransferase [Gammaproteobacteria bacterium]MDC1284769.1 1-acyl-sn-glycerol-3-phosphate acyltransferase [Gammaproteobacteria bacterium]